MTEKTRFAILGAGRLALALGRVLPPSRVALTLWARKDEALNELRSTLPQIPVSNTLSEAVKDAQIVFMAVPAGALTEVANAYGEFAQPDQIVLCASRGVGEGFALPHELIRRQCCARKIGILGGPLHTGELTSGRPLSAVLASRFPEPISAVKALLAGGTVTIHGTKDITGVQVAGAVSNASAIAAGIAEGLDLGDTARGILLTHGLIEARRLGVRLGASPATFSGLAGVGDLIPRRVTSREHHLEAGRKLGQGKKLKEALSGLPVLEGIQTAKAASQKAEALGLKTPLMSAISAVLEDQQSAQAALETVLQTPLDLDSDA